MSELIYNIDKSSFSEKDSALVIIIQEAKRDGFQLLPLENQRPLTKELLNKLSTPKDSNLLPFLISEEMAYLKKNKVSPAPSSFHRIHLSIPSIPQALKLFATTGNLYFNHKALVLDLYSKTEFFYVVNASSHIEGMLKSDSQEFPLSSCDFIGRGTQPFFIKGIQLKMIDTEVSWKDLKSAFEGVPRPLEELLEDANNDNTAPRVRLATPLSTHIPEPLPILMLKDRTGAFSDLFMDYGQGRIVPYYNTISQHGPSPSVKRQEAIEKGWEKDLLETDYIKKPVGTSDYYCPLDKVAKSLAFLLELGWQVRDWKNNRVMLHQKEEWSAENQGTEIVIKGKMYYENFQADLSKIMGAFNKRERFAEIAPGHVALLPNSWEKSNLDLLADEGEIVGDSIRIKNNNLGALTSLFESSSSISLDATLTTLKEKISDFKGINQATPGSGFKGQLRPYQQEGVNWLAFLQSYGLHGLLADDMGLGKTVQVLAFLSRQPLQNPVIIVMPTSLIFNWKRELERFLPSYPVLVYHGSNRQQSMATLANSQIILTTYTTLRLDLPQLSQLTYDCLILDEAQAIKNAQTQTFSAVTKLNAKFRLSLTGTPIENNLMELWSHFHFLMPDLLGDEKAFATEIQAGGSDFRFIKRVKRKIRPFLLRRTKEEVAKDLPEKIEQTVWIEMNEAQRSLYDAFLSKIRHNLISKVNSEGIGKHRMEVLEAIMRLRQCCCHPLLVSALQNEENTLAESSKLEALLQDLATAVAEKRKVLVYSQFTSMLALISQRIKSNGWSFCYLDGSTQNREKIVTQFQEDASIPIFLISLKAGGVGLNLTSADYVFLYDPWWNQAIEDQAINRAHRIGRKDTVIAKRYIMVESIEEKMMKLKSAKSSLANSLIEDEERGLAALSTDDLLFLLS